MAAIDVERYAFDETLTLSCVRLPDRRQAAAPIETFLYLNQVPIPRSCGATSLCVELIRITTPPFRVRWNARCMAAARCAHAPAFLYPHRAPPAPLSHHLPPRSQGAIYALLRRCSLSSTPLSLKRASVPSLVTAEEYSALLAELQESLPLESRVKQCTLLAVQNAVTCAHKLGRCERAERFLNALRSPLPRRWQLQAEIEQAAAENEADLAAEAELEDLEELEAPLHAELLHTCVPYESTEAEQEAVKHYKLERVPRELEAQLDAFRDWRLSPLCYARTGNAVVDVTAGNDRAVALRFLAFCHVEKGLAPSLAVFGTPELPDVVQEWLSHAVARGLMWSTLGNYVNALLNVTTYVWDATELVQEPAYALSPQPPESLVNLRAQCENQAKQQQARALSPRRTRLLPLTSPLHAPSAVVCAPP